MGESSLGYCCESGNKKRSKERGQVVMRVLVGKEEEENKTVRSEDEPKVTVIGS